MTAKQVRIGAKGRHRVKKGLDTIADTVKITLGPSGRHVMLEWAVGYPHVTKDGVKVARFIDIVDDILENMGARLAYEVAKKTSKLAGDGTTTASVLAQQFFHESNKLVTAGVNPKILKRGIDKAVAAVVEALHAAAKPVTEKADIRNVAAISANNDFEIGDIIADAMEKVGRDGTILAEEGKGIETTVEHMDGMHYNRGYISPYFITDAKRLRAELENPFVLIYDDNISTMEDLLTILRQIKAADGPLFLICDDLLGQALATLVSNKQNGNLQVAVTKPPGFGERRRMNLDDIAVLTGARVINKELGLELKRVSLDDLGRCKKVICDKDNTFIIGGEGSKAAIEKQLREIRAQIRLSTWDWDREQHEKRLAKLVSGVALVHVGGTTETEMKEKKSRIDNALNATRAAVKEGIVAGGGAALVQCASALDRLELPGDEQFGVVVTRRAISEPLRRIAENAGYEGALIVRKVAEQENGHGFNAYTGRFSDLIADGVIDPVKVTRLALQHAASLSSMLMTTEAVIADKYPKKKIQSTNPHATIPGMQQHMAQRAAMGREQMDAMIDEEIDGWED